MLRSVLSQVLGKHSGQVAAELVRDLGGELSWAMVRCLTPETYPGAAQAAGRGIDLDPLRVADCFRQFRALKRKRQVLDFEDLLDGCASLLEQRSDSVVPRRYRHFVVDEYQDTDPAQQRLLRAWLGAGTSICVVGDPHQAIYAFKGADPSLIGQFVTWQPGAVSISLVRDYRSTPQVVAVANRIVRATADTALVGQEPPGPEPTLDVYPDEESEVVGVVSSVQALLQQGLVPEQIAVLHRFNAQALPLRTALLSAGIATAIGDEDRFFDLSEVRQIMAALERESRRAPDEDALPALGRILAEHGFDASNPPPEFGGPRERHDNQAALLRLVETLPAGGRSSVEAAAKELTRRAEQERVPTSEVGVSVLTLHKAKGLEWDAVILPRMTDGSLPASMARTPEEQEEERRLFYVGVTRARRFLYLSYANTRNGYATRPSPFVTLLRPPAAAVTATKSTTKPLPTVAPHPNASRWPVGQRVLHDQFGIGTVTATEAMAVVVDFGATYGSQRVLLSTRKMTRI